MSDRDKSKTDTFNFEKKEHHHQCRRQSNQSKGALAASGRALKQTEFFCIKTDILRLQIMRYFNNFTIMSEKKRRVRPAAFLSSFLVRPI